MSLSRELLEAMENDFSDLEKTVQRTAPQTVNGVKARISLTLNDSLNPLAYNSGEIRDVCDFVISGAYEEGAKVVLLGSKTVVVHVILAVGNKVVHDTYNRGSARLDDEDFYHNVDYPGINSGKLNVLERVDVEDLQ